MLTDRQLALAALIHFLYESGLGPVAERARAPPLASCYPVSDVFSSDSTYGLFLLKACYWFEATVVILALLIFVIA